MFGNYFLILSIKFNHSFFSYKSSCECNETNKITEFKKKKKKKKNKEYFVIRQKITWNKREFQSRTFHRRLKNKIKSKKKMKTFSKLYTFSANFDDFDIFRLQKS